MSQIGLILLIAGGIAIIAVVIQSKSGTVDSVDRPDNSTGQRSQDHPEVPRAGPLDWDRDPPQMHKPAYMDSNTSQKGSRKTDGESHQDTDSQKELKDTGDLKFHWRKETGVSFDDVAGMDDVKAELTRDVTQPVRDKESAERFGISAPNVLFYGPPGTGKTYLAQALATELELPFVKLSGADVMSKWINDSATKVNELFAEAKRIASREGGAVVFIDELDSVLRDRNDSANAHAEDQKVVNEFLNQLQNTKDHDIVFLGATNREDILDDAAVRAGRIDKHIEIPMPDQKTRKSILQAHLDDRPHSLSESNIVHAAHQLTEASAADMAKIAEEAARQTVYRRGDRVRWGDVQMAIEDYVTNREF